MADESLGTDIVLYNRDGEAVTYSGIETITTDKPETEEKAVFTHGAPLDNVEVTLDLKDGDQKLVPPTGCVIRSATIRKPDMLIPENIKSGVSIGGVEGSFDGITEDDKAKLIPKNIRSGVTIMDVAGSMKSPPNWCSDGEAHNWTRAYFNTQVNWGTILQEQDYGDGETSLVGMIEANNGVIVGLIGAYKFGAGWYALLVLTMEGDNITLIPIYSTRAGTAEFRLDDDGGEIIYCTMVAGWNNTILTMPDGGGSIYMSDVGGIDHNLMVAGTSVAFGNYIPTPTTTLSITKDGTYDVSNYAKATVKTAPTGTLTITKNGTYDVSKYATVIVNIPTIGGSDSDGRIYVDGDTLVLEDGSTVQGDTVMLRSSATVDGDTLIISGGGSSGSVSADGDTLILSGATVTDNNTIVLQSAKVDGDTLIV